MPKETCRIHRGNEPVMLQHMYVITNTQEVPLDAQDLIQRESTLQLTCKVEPVHLLIIGSRILTKSIGYGIATDANIINSLVLVRRCTRAVQKPLIITLPDIGTTNIRSIVGLELFVLFCLLLGIFQIDLPVGVDVVL